EDDFSAGPGYGVQMRALPRVDRGWRQTDCTGRVGHGVDGEQRSVAADERFVPIPHGALGAREAPYVFEGPQLSPRIPLGERAMLRHLRASGLYAAPSERRSGPPRTLLVTPPHTISCRLVHTTLASRRPAIGAFGSARQEGRGLTVARAGLPAAAPAVVVSATIESSPAAMSSGCRSLGGVAREWDVLGALTGRVCSPGPARESVQPGSFHP